MKLARKPPAPLQLEMKQFDPLAIVRLVVRCARCRAKASVGVRAHFYYTPGFKPGAFVCSDECARMNGK